MKLTDDEHRALAFIAALLLLSAAVRIGALPEPIPVPDAQGFDLAAHIAATEKAVEEETRRRRPLAEGERLDPNRASAEELDRLPGVGPALADRILEARTEQRFFSAGDLTRVPGIGPRTIERLAPHLELPASLPGAGTRPGAEARIAPTGGGGTLDLNGASAEALEELPGVGPVLAQRIVAHRDSAGPFVAVDSLVHVKGIGPATLERLRPGLRVDRVP